jgi:hypothetical protein
VVEFRYSIDIQCRFNMALVGYFFFNVISVYDESSWRIVYDTACAKMGMVELYVKLYPLQSDWNDDLSTGSQPDSSSTPPQQSYIINTLSRPGVQGNISNQEKRINFDLIPTDNEDEDDEDYNGSEDEDEDEDEDWEDEEDIDDDDDDDEYIRSVINQVDQYNPFIVWGG